MVPELTEAGFLPEGEGVHRASWEAFRQRFVVFDRSDRRFRIGRQLESLLAEAEKSGIVRRVIVAGSIVTDKPEPNDFDCIVVLHNSIVGRPLRPFQYNLVSRRVARKLFGGDVVPVLEGSEALAQYLLFFQTSREGISCQGVRIFRVRSKPTHFLSVTSAPPW